MTDPNKRVSRRKARQQQLAKDKRKRQIIIIVPIVLGIIALGVFVFIRLRPVEGTTVFGAQDRGHDLEAGFAVSDLPPVGGAHDPRWQNCGIYREIVEIGPALHSMEHGAVWLTYRPDLLAEDVAKLQDIVRGGSYLLLSPFPDQKSEVVATAWGVQLELSSVADDKIGQFIGRYRGAGPEPGSPCDRGLGNPIR